MDKEDQKFPIKAWLNGTPGRISFVCWLPGGGEVEPARLARDGEFRLPQRLGAIRTGLMDYLVSAINK